MSMNAPPSRLPPQQSAVDDRDAFLLFNSRETTVEAIDRGLRQQGISTWYSPRDIQPGEEWARLEPAAMAASRVVLCFLGPEGWGPSHHEYMSRALEQNRKIIPVLLGETSDDALNQFNAFFRRVIRVHFSSPNDERALLTLVKAVRDAQLARPPADAKSATQTADVQSARPPVDVDRIMHRLTDGTRDERAQVIAELKVAAKTYDITPLRDRLVGETASFPYDSPLPERQIWLLRALAWVRQTDDDKAYQVLLFYLRSETQQNPVLQAMTLVACYEAGVYLPDDLLHRLDGDSAGTARPFAHTLLEQRGSVTRGWTDEALKAPTGSSELDNVLACLGVLEWDRMEDLLWVLQVVVASPSYFGLTPWAVVSALTHPHRIQRAAAVAAERFTVDEIAALATAAASARPPTAQFNFTEALRWFFPELSAAARIAPLLSQFDRVPRQAALRSLAANPDTHDSALALLDALGDAVDNTRLLMAGYVSDVQNDGSDDFNVTADVATLCAVILSREVEPPLSIGLFGDWGAGKTFFMDRMREQIASYATHPEPRFHSRVAQITFNAWHYVDANLWASLVSYIFEQLVAEIEPKEEPGKVRRALLGQLEVARELKAEAEREKQLAEKTRTDAQKTLEDLAEQRTHKQLRLADLRTPDLWQLARMDKDLRARIDQACEAFGLPVALRNMEELDAAVKDAHGIAGRAAAFFSSLASDLNWKTLLLLMGFLLVVVPLLALGLQFLLGQHAVVAPVAAFALKVGGVVSAAAALIRKPLSSVKAGLQRLEDARQKAHEVIERKRSERSQEEIALEKELNELRAKEVSATQQLTSADARIQEIEGKIKELDEGRSLARYLVERFQAGDYRKYLGLISTIRRDFENLASLLRDSTRTGGQPIERIVLYVDDLDRCPAERVVDVLQAVHLLLAFPLFVVVVGVDPRWVLHSLESRFSAFRGPRNKAPSQWNTTPQNYLEKIFHIPFSLRPMQAEGFGKMMRRLLPASRETPLPIAQQVPTSPQAALAAAAAASLPASPPATVGTLTTSPSQSPQSIGPASATAGPPRRPDVASLLIRPWEAEYAAKLFPFLPSPRATKRFTNLYRLLKAPLATGELRRFEGAADNPGDFRAPMILLAILGGFPDLSDRIFEAIQRSTVTAGSEKFLKDGALAALSAVEAEKVRRCLAHLGSGAIPDSLATFTEWIPRVARFSFQSTRFRPSP